MKVNFRKIVSFAGLFCGCMTTAAFAAQDLHSTTGSDNEQPKQITPDASPRVENGADLFFEADFIYWSVREQGLSFATSGFETNNTGAATLAKGKIYEPDFGWSPGFKVGAGLALGHDGWETDLNYTWINPSTSREQVTNATDSATDLLSTWVFDPADATKPLTLARGSWRLNFNTADLQLARNYFISHYLTLKPHVGLKASWQKQTNTVRYQETDNAGVITQTDLKMTQRSFGIGLRSGVDTAFFFDKNWSMFGDLALSALATHFNTTQKYTNHDIEDSVATQTLILAKFGQSTNAIKPVLEMALGLRWDYWFNDDSYHTALSLAWEQQLWWSMNQLNNVLNTNANSDLSMQGVTFKFRFDF